MTAAGPLAGRMIAISIGNAPDMTKLGYPSREVDRALFSICGALVRAGARIAYGGNLDPAGYTFKIFHFLAKAYTIRATTPPFVHYVPESVLRGADFDQLRLLLREGSGVVEALALLQGQVAATLVPLGNAVGLRSSGNGEFTELGNHRKFASWVRKHARQPDGRALTAMRQLVSECCDGRIIMGGRMGLQSDVRDQYSGAMPGVVEEALATLERRKPLIVLGAFGGATRDVAIALGLLPPECRVPRGRQVDSYDRAIKEVEALCSHVPPTLRPALTELASLDRTEALAHQIVGLLRSAFQ